MDSKETGLSSTIHALKSFQVQTLSFSPSQTSPWLTTYLKFKMATTRTMSPQGSPRAGAREEREKVCGKVRRKMDSSNAKEIKSMKLCKLNTSYILGQWYGT